MNRSLLFALVLLFSATTCFGQSATGDSQTLQALLLEVRELRQDIQTTVVTTQRVHILIYRVQGQETAVARASQRLDDVRDKLARIQNERKHVATDIKQSEDFASNLENPATERKGIEDRLPQLKTRLDSLEYEEQQGQVREIEAEQQLRTEEARLSDLRDQLDRLDKTLGNTNRRLPDRTQ